MLGLDGAGQAEHSAGTTAPLRSTTSDGAAMGVISRFKKLSLWKKISVLASIAPIIGVPLTVFTCITNDRPTHVQESSLATSDGPAVNVDGDVGEIHITHRAESRPRAHSVSSPDGTVTPDGRPSSSPMPAPEEELNRPRPPDACPKRFVLSRMAREQVLRKLDESFLQQNFSCAIDCAESLLRPEDRDRQRIRILHALIDLREWDRAKALVDRIELQHNKDKATNTLAVELMEP